jgi:hypothetical protein|nr:MAG TPA: hypothetical protein [Caudoviricetes sp.]
MIVKRDVDPEDFEFWGVAKARMDDATEEQRQLVCARIEDMFVDEIPTETDVNDFVWFECDDISYPEEEEEE